MNAFEVIQPCPGSDLHWIDCPIELATHRSSDGSYFCDSHGHSIKERAVVALIFDSVGQILTISRGLDINDLGLPGGKVEKEDGSDWTAIWRELYEETGLSIVRPIPIFTAWDSTIKGDPRIVTTFTGQISNIDELRNSREGKVRWAWAEELVSDKCTFHVYNKKLFKHLGIPL